MYVLHKLLFSTCNTASCHDNTELSLEDLMLLTCYALLQNTSVFPEMSWSRDENEEGGRLTLTLDRTPLAVRGWFVETTNVTVETCVDDVMHRETV